MIAIQVLVQAAIVVGLIPQQQWCRPLLASGMADIPKLIMRRGKTPLDPHRGVPSVGDGCQMGIERLAQAPDHIGQRVAEILVLAPTECVALHHDAAAKALLFKEVAGEFFTLGRRQ